MPDNFLSLMETAKRLGIVTVTLKRICERREIKHYKVGKRYKFDEAGIAEYLERNTYIAKPEPTLFDKPEEK